MKVSIIIPSYKPGAYLYECLKSIKSQTLSDSEYEIIIILNGCNDPYLSKIHVFVEELFGSARNVIVFQTDVPGVSNARNVGIEAAKGEYITFIDDDDVISSTYLEELLKVSSSTCIGCANSFAFVNDLSEQKKKFMSIAFERCKNKSYSLYTYRQFLSPPWGKLFHRDIICSTRFSVSLKKSEDSVFCLQLTPRIKEMKLTVNTAIYYQRMREGSAMRTKHSVWNEFTQLIKIECEYLSVWLKHPFSYNFLFFLSRMAASVRNFLFYIK